jgi:hypothetical protein
MCGASRAADEAPQPALRTVGMTMRPTQGKRWRDAFRLRSTGGGSLDQNACTRCGGNFRWESALYGDEERWIGVCECGALKCVTLDDPAHDPLHAVLIGDRPLQTSSPPYMRLYMASLKLHVRWRPGSEPCGSCHRKPVFETMRNPTFGAEAHARLCLSCGWVGIRTIRAGGRRTGSWIEGKQWTPACIAIKHLRNCIFKDHWTQLERRRFSTMPTMWGNE